MTLERKKYIIIGSVLILIIVVTLVLSRYINSNQNQQIINSSPINNISKSAENFTQAIINRDNQSQSTQTNIDSELYLVNTLSTGLKVYEISILNENEFEYFKSKDPKFEYLVLENPEASIFTIFYDSRDQKFFSPQKQVQNLKEIRINDQIYWIYTSNSKLNISKPDFKDNREISAEDENYNQIVKIYQPVSFSTDIWLQTEFAGDEHSHGTDPEEDENASYGKYIFTKLDTKKLLEADLTQIVDFYFYTIQNELITYPAKQVIASENPDIINQDTSKNLLGEFANIVTSNQGNDLGGDAALLTEPEFKIDVLANNLIVVYSSYYSDKAWVYDQDTGEFRQVQNLEIRSLGVSFNCAREINTCYIYDPVNNQLTSVQINNIIDQKLETKKINNFTPTPKNLDETLTNTNNQPDLLLQIYENQLRYWHDNNWTTFIEKLK